MKKLIIAIVLMFTPFVGHAEWNNHFKQSHHEQRHNNSYFWKDVEHRQHKQASRIQRGIKKGQLTRREAKQLHREQKHVAKQIRHLRRDNHLSRHDKREVVEHLDYVSGKIRNLKHNQHYAHRDHYSHKKQSRHVYSNDNNRNDYGKNRFLSWANDDVSAGVYFRF